MASTMEALAYFQGTCHHIDFLLGSPILELVQPAGEKSPVTPFLRRGGGLHYLCYEIDLEHQRKWSQQ